MSGALTRRYAPSSAMRPLSVQHHHCCTVKGVEKMLPYSEIKLFELQSGTLAMGRIQDKRVTFPKPDPTKFTLNLMLRIKRPPTTEVKIWIGDYRLRYDRSSFSEDGPKLRGESLDREVPLKYGFLFLRTV
ncbi:hypothetical protein AVEN_233231-1 [Araneus ventricosus]|uniref:Uncharacterized protein n=1 Tax=Araneus ventricosus TaxID=182803 RepID=A0A4Y2EMB2_ARAVE|nr:hypothetical protein AVEN_233231-1 [Araneus ventricosus]